MFESTVIIMIQISSIFNGSDNQMIRKKVFKFEFPQHKKNAKEVGLLFGPKNVNISTKENSRECWRVVFISCLQEQSSIIIFWLFWPSENWSSKWEGKIVLSANRRYF